MSVQMPNIMFFAEEGDDDDSMPPPRKVMKRGSEELAFAVHQGDVELSLPKQDWMPWVHSDSWHEEKQDEDECSDNDAGESTCSAWSSVSHEVQSQAEIDDGLSEDHDEQSSKTAPSTPLTPDLRVKLPTFSDIIGHNHVKLRLDEVLLPIALPPEISEKILVGIRSLSASILLFGPPGCGKTQLARAIAGEAEAAFISTGPSDILSKFVGESESAIRSCFDKAYAQARTVGSNCAVLFFDEIDALGQSRGGGSGVSNDFGGGQTDPSSRRVLAELLIQMNRLNDNHRMNSKAKVTEDVSVAGEQSDSNPENATREEERQQPVRIIVVAATNRPEDCDPALLRRFAVRVMVNLPTKRDRCKILKRFLKDVVHTISSEQLDALAVETEGWTGSDLESLTREAAMAPVRECIRAAALMKRRNVSQVHCHQQGGASTAQVCGESRYLNHRVDDSNSIQTTILKQFSKIRPVCIQDFDDAVAFWAYNQNTNGNSTCEMGEHATFNGQAIHYDSSSDEDD